MSLLKTSIQPLHVNAEELSERDHIVLREWESNALSTLRNLKSLLARREKTDLSDEERANIAANSILFDGDDFWTSESLRTAANELLESISDPSLKVVTCVLSEHIKPRFAATPHPDVNVSSGRRLPKFEGEPGAAKSIYDTEQQIWKMHPGTNKLLLWCIMHLKAEDYEGVWHLIVPPTMILLDDHQAYVRLQGVEVVSELLQHVPVEHLKRTGVDGLLIASLQRNTLVLHSPLTPTLLRKSGQVLLRVINYTTPPNSQARFDNLCSLLGEGIIGHVWAFALREHDTIEASLVILTDILRELGVGSVRYLKALVMQMVYNINPLDIQHTPASLQIASLQALEVIIEVCRPRIYQWRRNIIESLGRCWVALVDHPDLYEEKRSNELRAALRRVSGALAMACPSVVEDEYKRLLACDENMFRGLVSTESDM